MNCKKEMCLDFFSFTWLSQCLLCSKRANIMLSTEANHSGSPFLCRPYALCQATYCSKCENCLMNWHCCKCNGFSLYQFAWHLSVSHENWHDNGAGSYCKCSPQGNKQTNYLREEGLWTLSTTVKLIMPTVNTAVADDRSNFTVVITTMKAIYL